MDTFAFENVTSTYNGKPGCMCGCRGKYSEKDTRSAKITYNKVMNNPNRVYDEGAKCYYLKTDTRNLVVFF